MSPQLIRGVIALCAACGSSDCAITGAQVVKTYVVRCRRCRAVALARGVVLVPAAVAETGADKISTARPQAPAGALIPCVRAPPRPGVGTRRDREGA